MTGLRAVSRTLSTDCSSGEWKPLPEPQVAPVAHRGAVEMNRLAMGNEKAQFANSPNLNPEMMNADHLHSGIGLLFDKNWTTQQALAGVELLDNLREVILRHYHPQNVKFMRQNRSTKFDSHSCVDKYGESEPF